MRRVAQSHDRLLRRAMDDGSGSCRCRKLYSFHHAVNGFAVHTTASLAERLRAAPEVAAVEEDSGTRLMTTFAYVPQARADPPDDDGDCAGGRTLFAAEGVCSVGSMFPPGSCNGKIVAARYFAGGVTAVLPLDPSRDLSPFDAEGHGRLAVYKAVYPTGGTMADLIAAIDQATEDKVDVLVLSIGPDERPASKVTFLSMLDVALLSARRAGVFVAQAAGNRGPAESSVISYSPWVTTVAASTTGRSYTSGLVLGDGRHIPGLGLSAPTIKYRLVAAKDAASMEWAEECQDAEALRWRAGILRDSIVVCSFSQGFYNGTSTVTAILDVAEALGFAGFVLVANALYGDFLAQPLPFPRGATVFGATAVITEGRAAAFTDAAPAVARYSSRGPDVANGGGSTPADVLKPDILAPGDQVWAAWSALSANQPILAGDHFAMISGTSMAAPHVAGVAALIKQRHPSWGPAAIASALSTTAQRHDARRLPIMAEGFEIGSLLPATPFDRGAGFVNPAGALDPGLIVAPEPDDYVGFLCSLPQLSPDDVRAATGLACQEVGPLASPLDLNVPSITVAALRGSLSVRLRVTNVASDVETYLRSTLPPAGVDVTVRPGWFEVAPGETRELVIELSVTRAHGAFSFGEIVLTGSLDHLVRLPLAVRPLET
ncbi:unnamed protein product [Urochloa decumbens]|uniref:Uncharacterized protein n=1 Tax=Urochloa decumbens TaxID=240449 RepID=A0ABC9DAQ1_9POAL